MILKNCKLNELVDSIKNKSIIIWGMGGYFENCVKGNFPAELVKNILFFVDQKGEGSSVEFCGRKIPLFSPNKLLEKTNYVIMITGTNFMYEIYKELEDMGLGDDIECYVYPLILAVSEGKESKIVKDRIFSRSKDIKIPKVIHCFWFSREKRPNEYQKCVDSWKRICPDYEICEWNINNYDYTQNHFMRQAIEARKWAFAADFARLDVVYRLGGIYMDMDVELIKPLDILLNNEAFFTFDNMNNIDLATFGAKPQNRLLLRLMELYENVDFSSDTKTMNWLAQPRYIREALMEIGLELNGDMQYIDGMAFLNRKYLSPKDSATYQLQVMTKDTIAIHHYNTGWRDNFKERRILNNVKMWELVSKN